jgi:hypothetical protein
MELVGLIALKDAHLSKLEMETVMKDAILRRVNLIREIVTVISALLCIHVQRNELEMGFVMNNAIMLNAKTQIANVIHNALLIYTEMTNVTSNVIMLVVNMIEECVI